MKRVIIILTLIAASEANAQCGPNGMYSCGPPPMRGGYPGVYRERGGSPGAPRLPRPDYYREYRQWSQPGRPCVVNGRLMRC
jgi:hypothetical protein